MPVRLSREEVVTIEVLAQKGQNNSEIARTLGVSEGTVRYHRRRADAGAEDGRRDKPFAAAAQAAVIAAWMEAHQDGKRPANIEELYDHLVEEHAYAHSYRSVLRYVRAKYPRPRIRTYRRVETPPGAQTQTDWGEYPQVDVGDGPEPLHAFVMVLGHSRRPAVVWSRREDQLSWLSCHNAAYRRLRGVAAVNRIDNLKTGIARGAGAWGEINPAYRSYARAVGFHVDACNPGQPQAKGKGEAKVRLSRLLDLVRRPHDSLEHLQAATDERLDRWSRRAVCAVTGQSVYDTWQRELAHLAPLPILPEPFDVAVTRPVSVDCLVRFEGRAYAVPFAWADRPVEVRGCARTVQILAEGRIIKEYPRGTSERLLLDPDCYEGASTARVLAPPPLGKMGRRLQEIAALPVQARPVDLYHALAEVAR